MPEDATFLEGSQLLSFDEIARFTRIAAGLGVNKVRLTGGEPLLRKDLHKLVRLLAAIPGLTDIGLTTNGILLKEQAAELFDAGLRRLNVSLDTLDEDRFHELTRRRGLDRVLAGLEEAKRVGFRPIKVNAVSIRGVNDVDTVPLARYCREHGFELRFIEYMPIGAKAWEREKVFFAHEILDLLGREVAPPNPAPDHANAAGPGDGLRLCGFLAAAAVGIIASVKPPVLCELQPPAAHPPRASCGTVSSR